ncbi:MAG: hypothetical protein WAU16_07600 [Rhizobiaceae bacterium]
MSEKPIPFQIGPLAWAEYLGFQTKGEARLQARASVLESRALLMTPFQTRHLINGVVRVWKHAYPERESDLWLDTALLGVYSALRVRLLLRAVEIWFQRDPELDQRLLATLQVHLMKVRSLSTLNSGLEDMAQLTLELDEACKQVIPDLVWTHIAPKLTAENATNSAGTVLDPVCWMRLQPGQALASVEISHQTYYFCHGSCKERFLKDVQKFVSATP